MSYFGHQMNNAVVNFLSIGAIKNNGVRNKNKKKLGSHNSFFLRNGSRGENG